MGFGKGKYCKILLFVLALCAVLLIHENQNQQAEENRQQIQEMEQQLAEMGEEEIRLQRNLACWYHYHLDRDLPGIHEVYDKILNLGNGVMAALEVPELNLHIPVFHGESGEAGHLPESHFPVGGRGNHTILLVKGWYPWKRKMAVYIDCLGKRSAYRVESVQVMKSGWPLEWPSEQDRLTIFTDRGGLRVLVRCVRTGELNVRKEEGPDCFTAAALAILVICLPVPGFKNGKKRKQSGACRRKYPGFPHKTHRKSKLL
jgi:hypothetical protein